MAKETMLSYAKDYLEKYGKNFGFAIDIDRQNHFMEVIGEISTANPTETAIEDDDGVEMQSEQVYFEDAIVFYGAKKVMFEADEYLAAFPIDYDKGIDEELFKKILQQFVSIMKNGATELSTFLSDDTATEFSLKWPIIALEDSVSKKMLAFPKYGK